MLGFPAQILPMMGFSSCDNSDVFQWLKLVSIGGSCSEPFSCLQRVNQEIKAYLWVFVSHRQDDWADWLPIAEFAYNNHVHSTTCRTPFEWAWSLPRALL